MPLYIFNNNFKKKKHQLNNSKNVSRSKLYKTLQLILLHCDLRLD